jgi:hypothetical protein
LRVISTKLSTGGAPRAERFLAKQLIFIGIARFHSALP